LLIWKYAILDSGWSILDGGKTHGFPADLPAYNLRSIAAPETSVLYATPLTFHLMILTPFVRSCFQGE
jgi:hypothetical protein